MIPNPSITDPQRIHFLEKLHAATRAKNALLLTEWENQFLGSWLNRCRQSPGWFTEGRRAATDRMWMRYGPEINWPHPADLVTERPRLADADPAGCEYLVKLDGVQQRCIEPATCQEPGRLRYCQMHAEVVVKAMKFAGKTLRLVNLL